MATLSINPTETEFNEALNSFKTFAEIVLSGENKSQKQTYSAIVNIAKIAIFNRFLVLLLQLQ